MSSNWRTVSRATPAPVPLPRAWRGDGPDGRPRHRPPAEIHIAVELPVDHSQEVDDRCVLLGGVAAAPGQPAPGATPHCGPLSCSATVRTVSSSSRCSASFRLIRKPSPRFLSISSGCADTRGPSPRRSAGRPATPRNHSSAREANGGGVPRGVLLADLDQDGGHEAQVAIDLLARPVPSAAVGFGLDSGEVAVAVPQAVVLAGSGVPGELVEIR